MKFSKGQWFIQYVSGIPIGVNTVIEKSDSGTYSMNIVETILPDTDEQWEIIKEEKTANLKLISAAPELIIEIQKLKDIVLKNNLSFPNSAQEAIDKVIK